MKTLIVGDVHGCREELEQLIEEAGLDPKRDQLIFVGDLVAKGPDSKGVLKLAQKWKAKCVKGNHDQHVLKFRRGKAKEMRPHHLAVAKTLDEDDWRYLEAMPLWLRLPGMLVVHAGVLPGVKPEDMEPAALMNMRSITADGRWSSDFDGLPWASLWSGPERIIFGHDAVRGLQQYPQALGLDTGCVYGFRMTALMLPANVLMSVAAHKPWCPLEA